MEINFTPANLASVKTKSMKLYINFDDKSSKENLFQHLKMLSGVQCIDISIPKKGRSSEQNKYYWSVVVEMLSQETGYLADEIHDALKGKFLKNFVTNALTQEEEIVIKSTTELTTNEFEEYLEKCRIWAYNFFNVVIPLPNQIL